MSDNPNETEDEAGGIARMERPEPPEFPTWEDGEDPEPTGLEEIDPLGIGRMVDELADLDSTPGGPKTLADIKRKKRGRTAKVPLVLDASKRVDLINARAALQEAETALSAGPGSLARQEAVDAALQAVKAAEAALEDVTIVWELKSISRPRVRDLIAACPPTKAQRQRHRAETAGLGQAGNAPLFDPDRFQPALVSACSVEPELPIEEAVEMWASDDWTEGELDALFLTAWQLNQVAI